MPARAPVHACSRSMPNRTVALSAASSAAVRSASGPCRVGRAIDRRVVAHHDAAIARQVHVELHAVGACGHARDRTPTSVFSGPSARPPRCANTSGRLGWRGCEQWDRRTARRHQAANRESRIEIQFPMASSHPSTLGGLRRAVAAGLPRHATRQRRSPRQPDPPAPRRRPDLPRRRRLRRHGRARRSSTRCCRSTTSSCWACAARPRRGCCGRWSGCSTRRFRSSRAASCATTRSTRSARRAARSWRRPATTCPSSGCRARIATSRSWRRPT